MMVHDGTSLRPIVIQDLLFTDTVCMNGKIYYIGGYKLTKDKGYRPSNKVFSVKLGDMTF